MAEPDYKTLYDATRELAKSYLDWRLKLLSIYFTVIGVSIAILKWVDSSTIISLFAIFGFILSITFYFVNKSISQILEITLKVGKEQESKLSNEQCLGIYSAVEAWSNSEKSTTTSKWSRYSYIAGALLFIIMFVLACIQPELYQSA